MIDCGKLLTIRRRLLNMGSLSRYRRHGALVYRGDFRGNRPHVEAPVPAVVADVVYDSVVDDSAVVNVMNDVNVHVGDRPVISEYIVVPIAAFVASAHIAEAVIDAAVEADVGSPKTAMPAVS
jgi:hypothetical protein